MAAEGPVLDQMNLVVGNMAEMTAFYRRLGLEIPATEPPWDAHHVSVETGGDTDLDLDSAELETIWNTSWPTGATGSSSGSACHPGPRSTSATPSSQARVITANSRRSTPSGGRDAIVTDPDGNAVGLMSPVDPSRRTPPPDPAGVERADQHRLARRQLLIPGW